MIFVTTGTQEPFERLIKVTDEIASEMKGTTFIVQSLYSGYKAKNFDILNLISFADFNHYISVSDLVISHAGMGTILTALEKSRPIIVLPRLMKYNEHRNEHQLATAKKMDSMGYVDVAYDEAELKFKIQQMWPDKLKPRHKIGNIAPEHFIKSISDFIKF